MNHLYLVTRNNETYQIDLSNFQNIGGKYPYQINAAIFNGLKNKKIIKVYSGLLYYFALEREEIKGIKDWDNSEVVKWLKGIKGLEDEVKIFKSENINGADLINADKQFYIDRLGILREDL